MKGFSAKNFVKNQITEIKKVIGSEKAVIAVSGGVDSSTCAVLVHQAIGENLVCVILDDAFMREGEPERVSALLSQPPLSLPMKIENVQERFLRALSGLRDAEEKRKAFRKTFYETLSDIAKREGSRFLVQGTILADIIETKGGIKTQHNVLEQMGISTRELYGFRVVEPLVTLLKPQVRQVARYLKIPSEISERQPFPGPGLSVRVVGEIVPEKLASLKKATSIVEAKLSDRKPGQYFASIIDNDEIYPRPNLRELVNSTAKYMKLGSTRVWVKVFSDRATGMKQRARRYGEVVAVTCRKDTDELFQPPQDKLSRLHERVIAQMRSATRVLYMVGEGDRKQPYVVSIRSVETKDFLKAAVSEIPFSVLQEAASQIVKECPNVSAVYYDVTPKPPATIEME
jgi:GMP synthase (glutamine-hydrolysing)